MKKSIKISIAVVGVIIIILIINRNKIARLQFAMNMFSGKEQVERFRAIEDYFPTREIMPSGNPVSILKKNLIDLPETYIFNGKSHKTEDLIQETDITGLMVLKNDTILFEKYYQENTPEDHTIGWSVTKSIVSALVGIALKEGHIKGVNDSVNQYLPELKGSAYEHVTIKNLLQMSSGVSWNEDYSDSDSDINRFGRTLALGRSFESFVKTLKYDKPQGTFNRYNSSDTQVLGMIVSRATGTTVSNYLEKKLWQPLGMERKGYWVIDNQGNEFAAAGLSASLVDYAKFGLLFLHEGNWNGKQLIPKKWVSQSITPDAPHLLPGENENSNNDFGYGFQWWVFEGGEGEYAAMGIYNQLIYINPKRNIIIVKSAANNNYGITNDESSFREKESIAFLRAIVKSIDN
ncbi:serine hydrolase [Maribacter algarum]|uniref:Serine hydrolase n=1 Tax=Maribacter algarum (ex Zhang et al. 2020) TaxID=2578118 RepID=A0A5S3PV30_9FLAO|nr:serine hydrolase [Maribacter algarum]TMM56798.1 serine hydrolase [Maribacter algarum]